MEESNKVYVNAGILAMCLPGAVLTTQQQEDVMNSLLFAELSARVKHPQAQHNTEREQAVQRMLDNLCWIRLNQPGIVSKATRSLTVVDVVTAKSLSMFPSRVSSGFIELLKKLKFLPSQKALNVWHEKTVSLVHSDHTASTGCPVPDEFNVCVKFAILDAEGVLHTLMLAFATHTKLLSNYLSQTIKIEESAGLHVQAYTYELNAQCFSRLRESVAEKLKIKKISMYCLGPALLMANALPCSLNKVFDNAMNAKMIGSTLTSFVGEVSEASKQDIQDCLLYAQLYADRGGTSGPWTWLSNYQYALFSIGFSLKAYIVEQPLLISDAHQVRDYKVQVAGMGSSERLANLLGGLFDSLHLERDALSYLSEPPVTSHATHYQCAPCERNQQGELVVFVCALQLSCTPHDKNPALTFVRLNSKGGSFQFDAAVYAAMKNEVQDVIRGFTNTMIQNVEL